MQHAWTDRRIARSRYLKGFPLDDGFHPPRVELAALYFDQVPPNDIGHALAEEQGVPVFGTITQALTLGTSTRSNDRAEGSLAVDGVLIIGEHGEEPTPTAAIPRPRYSVLRLGHGCGQVTMRSTRRTSTYTPGNISWSRSRG
eukprot:COSAG01_NODE_12312_length_1762_cov_1.422129_3_plen_143_part_00